jgi:hypothetical protein
MRQDNQTRTALIAAAALVVSSSIGCGNKGGEAAGTGSPAGSAGQPAASSSAAAPPGAAQGSIATPTAPKMPGGIQVAIKDFQLFHPYSTERAMPNVRDNGTYNTRDSSTSYGVGVIVEATNETGEVLTGPWFDGEVHFVNGDRDVDCKFSPDGIGEYYTTSYTLHYNNVPADAKTDPFTGEKPTAWRNESGSTLEHPWRPGEKIRFFSRKNDCDSILINDLPPSQVRGKLVIKANKRFVKSYDSEFDSERFDLALTGDNVRIRHKASGYLVLLPVRDAKENRSNIFEMIAAGDIPKDATTMPLSRLKLRSEIRYTREDIIESAPLPFEVPPQAMTLQMVKLDNGELVHASGNVLVYVKEGKVTYQDMARQKLSLLEVSREDVPASTPAVTFTQNELSGTVKSIAITDHIDEMALSKGQRRLTVTWGMTLQGDNIDARLRVPYDIAKGDYEKAAKEAESGDPAAKAEAAKTKSAMDAAETKYKTGSKTEREKIVKAFPCGDVKIATNRTTKSPSNGKAVVESCKTLLTANDVEVTMTFTLDRYELPVALVYSLGGKFTWSPVASLPLLKMDPR